ncbi:MAG: SDR family oxidoreductase, partial [Planctomycetota bacterium]
LIRAFAEALGEGEGAVVNISDWRAAHPGRAYLAYTVSKAGLEALTRFAARELAPRVRVNALALGAVLPPADGDPKQMERVLRSVPAGRAARIGEVTGALLFLVRNDFMTGETLTIDGGAHLSNA